MTEQLTIEGWIATHPYFDGAVYNAEFDENRLKGQIRRIFDVMKDGRFRTVGEIAAITGDPEQSIGAQIRNLRKDRFGGWSIEKRNRGNRHHALYEFRLDAKRPEVPVPSRTLAF